MSHLLQGLRKDCGPQAGLVVRSVNSAGLAGSLRNKAGDAGLSRSVSRSDTALSTAGKRYATTALGATAQIPSS